jgi:putative ABC transport system permease protein
MQTLETRLTAIPGVIAVTESSPLPLDGTDANLRWGPMAAADDPSLYQSATSFFVQPGYFAVMKAKLIAGRAFTAADNDITSRAIIVDELLAAKAFPGQSPQSVVGKQVLCRSVGPEPLAYRIIGVAQHERHMSLASAGREQVFLSNGAGGFFTGRWAVRTTGDPTRLIPAVRAVVAGIDPLVPLGDVMPMSAYVDRAMAATRFSLVMIGIFAVVAALLASIGLYGVLATSVRQRTAEIGVRMAFGATGGNIFRLIIGQGLALSGVGLVAGVAIALMLTRVLSSAGMLVSVTPTDPLTYAGISLLFIAMAALACWIPARRAAVLSPNAALRSE